MARTKQTARKAAGGVAPRKLVASSSSHKLRQYLMSQQKCGETEGDNTALFINTENTFRDFCFPRQGKETTEEFEPNFSAARFRSLEGISELFLRLDMRSCLDGNGIHSTKRKPLDLCFVLDISGSMSYPFEDDDGNNGNKTKFNVAFECLESILRKLSEDDRVSLIVFNTEPNVLLGLEYATGAMLNRMIETLRMVRCGGGTDLEKGLSAGLNMLGFGSSVMNDEADKISQDDDRFRRVIFMTDMMSSRVDEMSVISLASQAANGPLGEERVADGTNQSIYLTVVGIGVDISVKSLNQIAKIPGARYISAATADEFNTVLGNDFLHDVTPVAFDIQVLLPKQQVTIEAIHGAAELADTPKGSSTIFISSEFANPLSPDGSAMGGALIMQLQEQEEAVGSSSSSDGTFTLPNNWIQVSWKDAYGEQHCLCCHVKLDLPELDTGQHMSHPCDVGLRKAVALMEYVSCIKQYANKSSSAASRDEVPCRHWKIRPNYETILKSLLMTDANIGILNDLPAKLPQHILASVENAILFSKLKGHLLSELKACQDQSIETTNQNILQIISKIIELECKEIRGFAERYTNDDDGCTYPRCFQCPITHNIMLRPCIAADGHSYERSAIEIWLTTHSKSPITNMPLPHCGLMENYALRSAIEEFLAVKRDGEINNRPRRSKRKRL